MPAIAQVSIHSSQFPDQVRRELLESLRSRQLNHKFLYEGVKQTQKWLALHSAFSPSQMDPDCAAVYSRAFDAVAAGFPATRVHLIGIGCGGGQKDVGLLRKLRTSAQQVVYSPLDVSVAMVLVARQAALEVISETECYPLVLDLATTRDLSRLIERTESCEQTRLITFFGMLPNFEPERAWPELTQLLRPQDRLLFSANLAPGDNYNEGVLRILPQYDNPPTRDWLMGFLGDLGVERGDGQIGFSIETPPSAKGLKRVAAYFHFESPREIRIEEHTFRFDRGDSIRLFFSYRYTPAVLQSTIGRIGLKLLQQWVIDSGEEGVFLAARA